jgi:hypothetical protein
LRKSIRQFPETDGGIDCFNLSKDILSQHLLLRTEHVNVTNQSFRALVTYKNISKASFRVIKLDSGKNADQSMNYDEKYWSKLTNLKSVAAWTQNLPEATDYRMHSVEVKIDALPSGEYLLLASIADDFRWKKMVSQSKTYTFPISAM